MHEMSIAMEVCRMAEDRLGRESLPALVAVGLDVGEDAGVEPENLSFCLEALLAEPPFRGAKPLITRLPGDVLRVSYLEVEDGRPDD
jgi:hydrogenase nickel incorporation protein HypA/HybF